MVGCHNHGFRLISRAAIDTVRPPDLTAPTLVQFNIASSGPVHNKLYEFQVGTNICVMSNCTSKLKLEQLVQLVSASIH